MNARVSAIRIERSLLLAVMRELLYAPPPSRGRAKRTLESSAAARSGRPRFPPA